MNLDQILSDEKTFTDDMEMQLGENKVKLGDLRGLTKAKQKELSDRIEAAKVREQKTLELANKTAEIYSNLQTAQEEIEKQRTVRQPSDEDFDTNEWWKPVRERLTAREKEEKALKEQVERLSNAFTQALTIFSEDRWEQEFERNSDKLKKNPQYKDWDYTKARDYAAQHKLLDRHGLPSVSKAIAELTRADEKEEIRRQAFEEGKRAGEQRSRMAAMARPTSAAGGASRPAGKGLDPNQNFNDLNEAVGDDPELVEMLNNIGALTPGDLQ